MNELEVNDEPSCFSSKEEYSPFGSYWWVNGLPYKARTKSGRIGAVRERKIARTVSPYRHLLRSLEVLHMMYSGMLGIWT